MINIIGITGLLGISSIRDIKTKEINVFEVFLFGIVAVLAHIFLHNNSIVEMLAGAGIGVFLFGIAVLSNEKIGRGDALIVVVIGMFLGFLNTLELLWTASILALVVGAIIVRIKEEDRNYEIPFIPFLLMAYLLLKVFEIKTGVKL